MQMGPATSEKPTFLKLEQPWRGYHFHQAALTHFLHAYLHERTENQSTQHPS